MEHSNRKYQSYPINHKIGDILSENARMWNRFEIRTLKQISFNYFVKSFSILKVLPKVS